MEYHTTIAILLRGWCIAIWHCLQLQRVSLHTQIQELDCTCQCCSSSKNRELGEQTDNHGEERENAIQLGIQEWETWKHLLLFCYLCLVFFSCYLYTITMSLPFTLILVFLQSEDYVGKQRRDWLLRQLFLNLPDLKLFLVSATRQWMETRTWVLQDSCWVMKVGLRNLIAKLGRLVVFNSSYWEQYSWDNKEAKGA